MAPHARTHARIPLHPAAPVQALDDTRAPYTEETLTPYTVSTHLFEPQSDMQHATVGNLDWLLAAPLHHGAHVQGAAAHGGDRCCQLQFQQGAWTVPHFASVKGPPMRDIMCYCSEPHGIYCQHERGSLAPKLAPKLVSRADSEVRVRMTTSALE